MLFTDAYNRLNYLYANAQVSVNNSLRIDFQFNNSVNSVYYSQDGELLLIVEYQSIKYPLNIVIVENNNEYEIGTWIPHEVYSQIKSVLVNWMPDSLFIAMQNAIFYNPPVISQKVDISRKEYYHCKKKENLPFFETFVRQNMSPNMKSRIRSVYCSRSKDIIDFCTKHDLTLRFTDIKERKRDLFKEILIKKASFSI